MKTIFFYVTAPIVLPVILLGNALFEGFVYLRDLFF